MHIKGKRPERADAPWSHQKRPAKKFKKKKRKLFFRDDFAAEPVQGGRAHGEKGKKGDKKGGLIRAGFSCQLLHTVHKNTCDFVISSTCLLKK